MKSIALEDVWLKRNDKCSNLRKKKKASQLRYHGKWKPCNSREAEKNLQHPMPTLADFNFLELSY